MCSSKSGGINRRIPPRIVKAVNTAFEEGPHTAEEVLKDIDEEDSEKIFNEIGNKNVKYIICTHYHYDHTDALEEVRKKTKAQVLLHKNEKEYVNFLVDKYLEDREDIKIGKENDQKPSLLDDRVDILQNRRIHIDGFRLDKFQRMRRILIRAGG